MFILKMIRKAGKFIRGGASPLQIALGAFLGVFIGFIPGFNLLTLLAVTALVIFNAHLGTALLGLGIGKICMHLLAPASFRIGYAIIHNFGIESLFAGVINAPVLAFAGLERYCTIGAMPFIVLAAGLYAYAMIKSVRFLRTVFFGAGEAAPFITRIAGFKPVAFLIRIIFGKKKDVDAPKPMLRKSGVVFAGVVACFVIALEFFALNTAFRWGAVYAMEKLNGAEVNVEVARLSLFGGSFVLSGLELTDPEKPEYNRFQTAEVTADISLRDLLARRLTVSRLSVRGVRTGTRREVAGAVYEEPPPLPDPDPDDPSVFDYFKDAENVERAVRFVADLLERQKERSLERMERMEEPARYAFETAESIGYLNTTATELLRRHPALSVREIEIAEMEILEPVDRYKVVVSELTTAPVMAGKPTELHVFSSGPGAETPVWIGLNLHLLQEPHRLRVNMEGIPVGKEAGFEFSDIVPVRLLGGVARVEADGRFQVEMLDIPFSVTLSGLDMEIEDGESIAGMGPELSGVVASALATFSLYGRLHGRMLSPRVSIDTSKTVSGVMSSLADIGREGITDALKGRFDDIKDLPDLFRKEEGDEDAPSEGEELEDMIRSLF